MRKMMLKLWNDDAGIVALEYLLVATIIGLGLTVGLAAVEGALDSELVELANAITVLDQSYSFCGVSTANASMRGTYAADTALTQNIGTYNPTPSSIGVLAIP